MVFFVSVRILIEHSVSKQWRPCSDATFCGVRSGSGLFAYVQKKDDRLKWDKNSNIISSIITVLSLLIQEVFHGFYEMSRDM